MDKNTTFEEALMRLEDIIKKLEGGSASLADSLCLYEEAIGLVKVCNDRLENAEAKIRILCEDDGGVVTDAPFAIENEA